MSCPFAKFAGILPASAAHVRALHGLDASVSDTHAGGLSLSDALRVGTARSHRAVEKSRGVSLLLQTSATAADAADEGLSFDRTDYTRLNIMLACIYTVLESVMVDAQSSPLIAPLFEDAGLVAGLARSKALLADVHAHLDTIHAHTGADLRDLADHARDDHTSSSTLPEDSEDPLARARLLVLVQAATPHALSLTPNSTAPVLGEDHIALLRPAQVHATLAYVERLTSIHPDLLLAHAYTRYLGDLSGGQHIVRKVTKRFPTSPGDNSGIGFQSTDGDTSECLATPPLPLERILPPEQMIHAFDQLRAEDAARSSSDWLGGMETATRRGSVDWAAAYAGRERTLRGAASQTFAVRGSSMDLQALARVGATGPRLRTSTSAWDLAAVKGARAEASPVARAESLEEVQDENVRSLPAPPRASKRRALVSTGAAASPRLRPAPFGDRTNALQVAGLPDVGELCIDDRRPAGRGRRTQGAVTA